MANEYMFFDDELRDRFVAFLADHGIRATVQADPLDGEAVRIAENLGDDLEELIEAHYDELMDEQRERVNADDDEDARELMGVEVTLPDGPRLLVPLPADYGRRLYEVFSSEEIQDLVRHIVLAAADPVDGPLCCAVRRDPTASP
jgi:hypothetical protein